MHLRTCALVALFIARSLAAESLPATPPPRSSGPAC